MATQIGPKIGVDGEAEYRRQMAGVIAEAKALKAEMTALKTEVTDEANAQENAKKQTENFNRQIELQQERVSLLSGQLERAVDAYGAGSTQASAYREQLANAKTMLNEMRAEQQGATESVEAFSTAEGEAGQNALTAGDLIKANLISEAILSGLRGLADLAERAAKALWNTATGAAEYADEILTLSAQTGVSTERLQELSYAAELVDVDLSTMTGSMSKLLRSMDKARGGSEETQAAFDRLGIAVTGSDGSLRDSSEVFFEIIDALGQIESGGERDALAMELLGKGAQELNPLIEAGSDALARFAEEAHAMGYVLDDETLGQLGELDDSLRRLDNLKLTILNQLGAGMSGGVTDAVNALIELGQKVDWASIGSSIGSMIESLASILVRFVESGALEALIDKINAAASKYALLHPTFEEPTETPEETARRISESSAQAALEYAQILQRINDPSYYTRSGSFDDALMQADQSRLSALRAEHGDVLQQLTAEDLARLAELAESMRASGADAMASYADGITSGAELYLRPAIEAAAEMVASYLHHSEPDVGPMADDSQWMPDMLRGWAGQIDDNAYLVRDAMAGLAFDMSAALRGGAAGGINYGGVSVVINTTEGQSAADIYDEFSYRLQQDVLQREAVFG